jgi:hypothetical protein
MGRVGSRRDQAGLTEPEPLGLAFGRRAGVRVDGRGLEQSAGSIEYVVGTKCSGSFCWHGIGSAGMVWAGGKGECAGRLGAGRRVCAWERACWSRGCGWWVWVWGEEEGSGSVVARMEREDKEVGGKDG